MTDEAEILVHPDLSQDYKTFEEFCTENAGQELTYLEVVKQSPLEMDPVTLAFSMRHLVRLSRELLDLMLFSLDGEANPPELQTILALKGVQLDKTRAASLRDIVLAFRDAEEDEVRMNLVRAFQVLTISRERQRVTLNLGESYTPPDEGWTEEDFGGDDSMLETVRAIEDPRWQETEEV
jgi:hypothetical protein